MLTSNSLLRNGTEKVSPVAVTHDRITLEMSLFDVVFAISEGNPGALQVLMQYAQSSSMGVLGLLTFDSKRLYGSRIWDLYNDICGKDLNRFAYHLEVELPNQETGQLSVSGPFSPAIGDSEFWEKRRAGKPGSFWALDTPPSTSFYDYPII